MRAVGNKTIFTRPISGNKAAFFWPYGYYIFDPDLLVPSTSKYITQLNFYLYCYHQGQ